MKILRNGKFNKRVQTVRGECSRCGCQFSADITLLIGIDGTTVSYDADGLEYFVIYAHDRYTCSCPHCGYRTTLFTAE